MIDPFISCALQEVRRGLAMATVEAGLDKPQETVACAIARRFSVRLRELEIILRRLMTLLALSLKLAPVQARNRPSLDGEGEPVQTKSQPLFSLSLSGPATVYLMDGDALPQHNGAPAQPVEAARLLRRFAAFARILRHPERYARRLARTLERRRKAGERPPICPLADRTHRLHPELGIIATGLPRLLTRALKDWFDTG